MNSLEVPYINVTDINDSILSHQGTGLHTSPLYVNVSSFLLLTRVTRVSMSLNVMRT